MELGEKLKQARLEAGLSQRQLCGDTITRNMLSQIENGSAKPSLATLQVLSARLGKPVSYFRKDAPSENLGILHQASQIPSEQAQNVLEGYLPGDPILDEGYYLLVCRVTLKLAEQAISQNRMGYACSLLKQAKQAGEKAKAFDALFSRKLALLRFAAGEQIHPSELPDNTEEMYLRAAMALENGNPEKCLACLQSADRQTEKALLLQGEAYIALNQYKQAIFCFPADSKESYPKLELCYRELGDFEQAYRFACLQR